MAAAAAVVLVIGLAVSVSNGLFGTQRPGGSAHLPAGPHRFYLTTSLCVLSVGQVGSGPGADALI